MRGTRQLVEAGKSDKSRWRRFGHRGVIARVLAVHRAPHDRVLPRFTSR
ncbi:hypothetical protein trd_A0747 (plasmid) [Thermomicrobium roseum DSM 5159]|uniref:Uncharacterized protein n=1 Tax=Thermomicrobium roseum (strain ATCC 27502 / DSM 5159 / P-2) TaxID=309801 RepID=B9L4N3_THERP|nr:hypothetical protein trd_A0747 [Thermomicrobium roseum DSM 5159]